MLEEPADAFGARMFLEPSTSREKKKNKGLHVGVFCCPHKNRSSSLWLELMFQHTHREEKVIPFWFGFGILTIEVQQFDSNFKKSSLGPLLQSKRTVNQFQRDESVW